LGWSSFTPPMAINTIPRAGRDACIECRQCVGFACPTDAKNGTHNTMIPRARATKNCDLVTGAMVQKIDTDAQGKAIGITYFVERPRDFVIEQARAKTIVVSAGAFESARLLLNSKCDRYPNGLGNDFDQVGRHIQGHYYPTAFAIMPEPVFNGRGPGVT